MKMKPMHIVENLPGNVLINQWILVDVIFPNHFGQFNSDFTRITDYKDLMIIRTKD